MTILAIIYLTIAYHFYGEAAKVPQCFIAAPFIDIVLIVAWFVSLV